jgi:hypothetical protein
MLYQMARLLILFDLDCIENFVQLVRFSPVLRVAELLKSILGYKTTRAQIAPVSSQCPADVTKNIGFCAYSIDSSSWLAGCPPAAGV